MSEILTYHDNANMYII